LRRHRRHLWSSDKNREDDLHETIRNKQPDGDINVFQDGRLILNEITSKQVEACDFQQVKCIAGFDRIKSEHPGYLSDESKVTVGPFDFLFFPENEAQLSAVVKEMAARKVEITVAGARTGLVGGCVPPRGALVSLEKMDRLLGVYYDSNAEEWRIRAETGICLDHLATMALSKSFPGPGLVPDPALVEQIRLYRQDPGKYFYPPDPTEMSASLGGTVATNASGARTYRYGPTRDWVRKISVMTATGEILDIPRGKYFSSPSGWFVIYDSGGHPYSFCVPNYTMPRTKNTAGIYTCPHMDLIDLFIGSEGIFGIITAVDVGLLAWEPKCSIVQFTSSDRQALELVQKLRSDKRLKLDFLEFYSVHALDLLRQMQAQDCRMVGMPSIPQNAGAAVFFELSFDPLEKAPDFKALESTVASAGASLSDSWAGYEPAELARFKHFRHLIPEKVSQVIAERKKNYPAIHRLSSDLAVPDEHLCDMWNLYQQRLDEAGLQWVGFGHVGNNHLHISSMPRDMQELERGLDIYAQFAQQAVAYGGAVSAEHGIGKIKAKFLAKMYSPDQIDQMRAVKKALDPGLLLNPGNIFAF
jgi:D-lactate dehydrogenase (cytochrome)